jgi:hypothetical protein
MFSVLRGRMATFALCALLLVAAAPVQAASLSSTRSAQERSVPVVMDALFLRPVGLVMTIGGAVMYGVAAPFVAITRPSDIAKPLEPLVLRPARYTFVDPLGEH